jgi:hypothetical protein
VGRGRRLRPSVRYTIGGSLLSPRAILSLALTGRSPGDPPFNLTATGGSLVFYGRDGRPACSPRPHSRWVSTRPRPCPVAR